MKNHRLLTFLAVFTLLLLLLPIHQARSQDYTDYRIQLNPDGSAGWTITRVSDINATIDVEGFPAKVTTLIEDIANQTQRDMTLNIDSLQVSDEISWETQSRKTTYFFIWQNFSIAENSSLRAGDVFSLPDFFIYLFGDGTIQIAYPSNYQILAVTPAPDEFDNATQTLKWFRTQDFISGKPSLSLTRLEGVSANALPADLIVGAALAVVVAFSLAGFYLFRTRRPRVKSAPIPVGMSPLESDEERIIKLIQSSGGSMRQSAITQQCGFSKAKTSQLLSVLEERNVVTRYKKGRDKIVTLSERATGEKP